MDIEVKLNYEYLIIEGETKYYGGVQEWYKNFFKKMAGCGPTTASTMTMYESRKKNLSEHYSKDKFINLMEELWNYVTPRTRGLNRIEYYVQGYDRYIRDNNIQLLNNKTLKIPKQKEKRPNKKDIFEFLSEAIKNNHPVAFLNLNNGKEEKIDSWHWVTVVGVMYNDEKNILKATITDEGVLKNIDLGLWLETTTEEGGFVYYE